MVLYRSTRGAVRGVTFEEAVFMGLAKDRGLLVPEEFPSLPKDALQKWKDLSFPELAVEVISLFVDDSELPRTELKKIVEKSYSTFRHKEVVEVRKVGQLYVMELFHGPTFAFKDIALQFLGNLFEYFLSRPGKHHGHVTILGATSGDTGSSAIAGLRGKENVDVYILFPEGRVSPVQERQMTSVLDANVHNMAVAGSFDDCQHIVKECFADADFKAKYNLGAVNSINWARILAQIVYYFFTYFKVIKDIKGKVGKTEVDFSVPTGNFGDILAGYYAKKLGLPIGKLIVATNENDILHRFFTQGKYHKEGVVPTLSPSMDICISSNFERFLFDLADNDPGVLKQWMADFEKTGALTIEGQKLRRAKEEFSSARVDQKEVLETVKKYFDSDEYIFDPHTAIGVGAAEKVKGTASAVVVVGTAHPGKFLDAAEKALGFRPPQHPILEALEEQPTRVFRVANSAQAVKHFIEEKAKRENVEPCVYARLMPFSLPAQYKEFAHNPVVIGAAVTSLALVAGSVVALMKRR